MENGCFDILAAYSLVGKTIWGNLQRNREQCLLLDKNKTKTLVLAREVIAKIMLFKKQNEII